MQQRARKWDAFNAAPGGAPYDSRRPASQLVAWLGSACEPARPMHAAAAAAAEASTLEQLAAAANASCVWLPPQAPELPALGAQPPAWHVCAACQHARPPARRPAPRALELGCGTGASSIWLAAAGFDATGIDVCRPALEQAAAAAPRALPWLPRGNPAWLCQDLFELAAAPQQQGVYDLVFDCQVYHVLLADDPERAARLPQLLAGLLSPGGVLCLLCGNANEPACGPNTLAAEQLLRPFLALPAWRLLQLQQTRFDPTQHYMRVLGKRPLAWHLLLQRA